MKLHTESLSFLEFHDLIIEAQEFKNFGFSLNRTLRMAIMRKRALFDDVEHLIEMIKAYKHVIKRLSSAEVRPISILVDTGDGCFIVFSLRQIQILKEHLFKTESKIQAGLGRYTWQSMNIKQFCKKCLLVMEMLKFYN